MTTLGTAETISVAEVACLIVTYHPDVEVLGRLLEGLPTDSAKVIVDNASGDASLSALRPLVQLHRCFLVTNPENRGLAAAQNQAVEAAISNFASVRFALFLDQDTEPLPGSIDELLAGYRDASARLGPGAAGAAIVDIHTGLAHGFHVMSGWRWLRVYPEEGSTQPVSCANLNSSGTLVPVDLWQAVGGAEADLFIDHVDTEWSFRMLSHGYLLHGIPSARFQHRMGDASKRIWLFGWRVWPVRSPLRHYYLFRNAVRLMRRPYVPRVWKVWAGVKLVATVFVTLAIDRRRFSQLVGMVRGIREAAAG